MMCGNHLRSTAPGNEPYRISVSVCLVVQVTASDTIDRSGETFSINWSASFHGNVRGACIGFIWPDDPLRNKPVAWHQVQQLIRRGFHLSNQVNTLASL